MGSSVSGMSKFGSAQITELACSLEIDILLRNEGLIYVYEYCT